MPKKLQTAPMAVIALAGAALIVCASSAKAFFPLVTDDTSTMGLGGQQLDLAYGFFQEYDDELDVGGRNIGNGSGNSSVAFAYYTYGLTDAIDLSVGMARELRPTSGWLNSTVGLKWRVFGDSVAGWSLALRPALILPVSQSMQDVGLGNARLNWGATVIASHVNEQHEVNLNAGYVSNLPASGSDAAGQRTDLWNFSVSPVLKLGGGHKLGLDLGIRTNPGLSSEWQFVGGIGLLYSLSPDAELGLAAYAVPAINAPNRSWAYNLTASVSWRF